LPDNFKLFWRVFVEEADWDAHRAVVVVRYCVSEGHFDCVVVVEALVRGFPLELLVELPVLRHAHEVKGLVAAAMV
jgi:hypothetical protein